MYAIRSYYEVKKRAGANQQQFNAEVSGQDSNLAQKSITGKILGESVNVETIAERRYLWTARAFSVIAAVSFCCNIALIMAIFQLVPLTRIEPFMISFADRITSYNVCYTKLLRL